MEVGIGIFGAGVIGQLRAATINRNPHTRLVTVCDIAPENARRAAYGTAARIFGDYREALDTAGLDAVVVCTPIHLHEEIVLAAIDAGKSVLCEKPLSNSVASCRRIIAAANAARCRLAVGYNHRYFPCFSFLNEMVHSGAIGNLDHLRLFGGHDGIANLRSEWMYKRQWSGGGAMMDVGSHITDLARFVMGEISCVYGSATNRVWNIEGSEDNAIAILKGSSGVPAVYQATWTEWRGFRYCVDAYGDRGMVRASYGPMFNLLVTRPRGSRRAIRRWRLYPRENLREALFGWQATARTAFAAELCDFVKLLSGEPVSIATGADGMRAVVIAQAVYDSSARGAPVTLPDP